MKTSIIILNYNAGNLLIDCLSSVFRTKNKDFEVIVVDNASNDASPLQAKEKFPMINLIQNKTNLGFCEGNNVGIRNSNGEFMVLLNPDTKVEPDWLEKLFDAYDKHGEGLYQPKILDLKNRKKINTAGNTLTPFGYNYVRGFGLEDKHQFNKDEVIGYVSGACLFTSRSTLDKIGYLDPYFFAYYDDASLSWRAAHQGIKSYFVPSSIVYHFGSYSFKKKSKSFYLMQRNRWYLLLTHYSKSTFYRLLPSILVLELLSIFYYISKGMIKEKFSAYKDIIKDRKRIYKKYQELESKKKLSDKEIIFKFMYTPKFCVKDSVPIFQWIFNKIDLALFRLNKIIL